MCRLARRFLFAAFGCLAAAIAAAPAQASEGGASFYLLGSGGPGAAIMPPLEGIFFDNTTFFYEGDAKADRQFVVGGNLVAGLDARIIADFPTILWVPSTDILGGTLALGAIVPFGDARANVDLVLTGPGGGQIGISRRDDAFVVGDPVASAILGWRPGKNTHLQVSTAVNIPIGHYREGELANLAFHRWVVDTSVAATWRDPEAGWDLSAKAGVTFNGRNDVTDYNTGSELHLEAAVERIFSKSFSAGAQIYHFHQLTGDSGEGAVLGPNKGRVTGVGATAAYNFMVGRVPVTARARLLTEFDAERRLEGTTALLSFTFPLKVKMPPSAQAPPPAPLR